MKDWLTVNSLAMDIAIGQLQTPSNTLGIANLFPRSKVALRLVEDIRGVCTKSSSLKLQANHCADVVAMEGQITNKSPRYYKILHKN